MKVYSVECRECGKVFGAKCGWQPWDEAVVARLHRRGEGDRVLIRGAYPLESGNREMRVPLRARRCGDHAEGTPGCTGSLRRCDLPLSRPMGPPDGRNGRQRPSSESS